jgi:hypothetical protein
VAYLATSDCPLSGRVFFVYGGQVRLMAPWQEAASIKTDHRWTVAELRDAAKGFADVTVPTGIAL